MALFLVIDKVTFVFSTVSVIKYALSILHALVPIALIFAVVWPLEKSFSLELVF